MEVSPVCVGMALGPDLEDVKGLATGCLHRERNRAGKKLLEEKEEQLGSSSKVICKTYPLQLAHRSTEHVHTEAEN